MNNENFDQENIEEKNTSTKKVGQNFFSETIKFALIAFVIVIPIRIFIAQPFIVSGSSMEPTFHGGDYLIVDELSYRFNDPKRGDVIIFKIPDNEGRFLVKRIIGLPNEEVEIVDGNVFIKNGDEKIELDESYIVNKSFDSSETKLKDNEYFVMGDNRPASFDSRSWGALPKNFIRGRALIQLLPINKISLFPGFVN